MLKAYEDGSREGIAPERRGGVSEHKVGVFRIMSFVDCVSLITRIPIQQQELLNLQRENKLMTSAWYGLANRLQMNNVGLQRREPRSFLKKQRYQLNQTSVRIFS